MSDTIKTQSGKEIHHHEHEIYRKAEKRPKWNVQVHPLMNAGEGGKMLRARLPHYSKQDYLDAAQHHHALAEAHNRAIFATMDVAHHHTFGTTRHPTDYQVSGIGRNEYHEHYKEQMRHHVREESGHRAAAEAHESAARGYSRFRQSQPTSQRNYC